MARRRTHIAAGMVSGAVMAAYAGRREVGPHRVIEVVGGALGGALGAVVPDLLEPAINSWHRSLAHSYITAGMGIAVLPQRITAWQEYCRSEAGRHEDLCAMAADDWGRFGHALWALLSLILSGLAVGLAVGYASHLALDLTTPRGLPLLV